MVPDVAQLAISGGFVIAGGGQVKNTEREACSTQGKNETVDMIGAVDMGSKNFKFVVGQNVDGVITTELIRKERFELGREVSDNNGLISEERIDQVRKSLSQFVAFCKDRGAPAVLGVAASAIRNARNYERIRDIAHVEGVNLEIADGAREGKIGYFAATGGVRNKLVTEVGSKSTQITWDRDGDILSRSVSVGYEQAYESFVEHASTLSESEQAFHRFLDGNFGELPSHTDQYVALAANTATSFVVQGQARMLNRDSLDNFMGRLRALPPHEYGALKSSLPKADKILPGLIFIQYVMRRTGHREVHASPNELPVGLIVEYFLNPE